MNPYIVFTWNAYSNILHECTFWMFTHRYVDTSSIGLALHKNWQALAPRFSWEQRPQGSLTSCRTLNPNSRRHARVEGCILNGDSMAIRRINLHQRAGYCLCRRHISSEDGAAWGHGGSNSDDGGESYFGTAQHEWEAMMITTTRTTAVLWSFLIKDMVPLYVVVVLIKAEEAL